jgi:hypothetical protein
MVFHNTEGYWGHVLGWDEIGVLWLLDLSITGNYGKYNGSVYWTMYPIGTEPNQLTLVCPD